MTLLLFMHDGWEVVASSWSVAAKSGANNQIEICYPWSSHGGVGWLDSSTGVARVTLPITLNGFYQRLTKAGSVIDLRDL